MPLSPQKSTFILIVNSVCVRHCGHPLTFSWVVTLGCSLAVFQVTAAVSFARTFSSGGNLCRRGINVENDHPPMTVCCSSVNMPHCWRGEGEPQLPALHWLPEFPERWSCRYPQHYLMWVHTLSWLPCLSCLSSPLPNWYFLRSHPNELLYLYLCAPLVS